jgi:hypothetical protein
MVDLSSCKDEEAVDARSWSVRKNEGLSGKKAEQNSGKNSHIPVGLLMAPTH